MLQDLGIGYLPTWMVARELETGALLAVLADHAAPGTPVHALYAAQRLLPRRASVFIDFITGVIATVPGLSGVRNEAF